jgi:ferredoxin-NADP reductase
VGRLAPSDVDPLVRGGETVFVCGSTGFADAATTALLDAGVPTHLIRVERFGPSG